MAKCGSIPIPACLLFRNHPLFSRSSDALASLVKREPSLRSPATPAPSWPRTADVFQHFHGTQGSDRVWGKEFLLDLAQ